MNVTIIEIGISEIIPTTDAYIQCGYDLINRRAFLYGYVTTSKYKWITLMYQRGCENNLLGVWVK